MFLKKVIFCFNVFLIPFLAIGQENNIAIGEWRVHLPYTSSNSVELVGNRTYSASEINGFYLDHSDNSVHILSTINGLNDIEITKMRYHKGLGLLIIAYANGNIDVIRDNTSININDIERKNIIGSKKINHIYLHGNFAYLSCDFGLSVLNLTKLEIKETYSNLAPGGLSNKVYGCTFSTDGDSIFLATERGVMAARNAPGVNLMDFSNWYTYGPSNNISTTNIQAICTFNNKIYAGRAFDSMVYLDGNSWIATSITLPNIKSMNISQGKLLICMDWGIVVAESESSSFVIGTSADLVTPVEALLDNSSSTLWIADYAKGLLSLNLNDNSFTRHLPNGPLTKSISDIYYYNNQIVVSRGAHSAGYNVTFTPGEYYVFDNYSWKHYNNNLTTGFPAVTDVINATYNSSDDKLYLPIYGYGILVKNPDNSYYIIDDTTVPFVRALPGPGGYVRVTDVEPDSKGNLWVSYAFAPTSSDHSLFVRRSNGTWTSRGFGSEAARFPVQLLVDDEDNVWLRLRTDIGGGIIVYNDKLNDDKYLTDQPGDGGLPGMGVRAFAKDKKGGIWVGTDKGVAVFHNPENIFSSSSYDAVTPIFDGFPLLYNEYITCIKVDGGNRKWIGTKNGLWLLNDDGTEVIANFTTKNSPLLSNNILKVEIHEKTGEVFIGTDKGLISYRGTATESKREHSDVKVFPNPVKPDFNGLVGISGLTTDAVIKITDIYGNLIYETKAEGGTAVWNAKNYNGERARTGVYLIFSSSEDGEETFVAKVAVIE